LPVVAPGGYTSEKGERMTLAELDRWLSSFLAIAALDAIDNSQNGLQVGSRTAVARKVAFAVDASMESFRRAAEWGADTLFVHHGILWDRPLRITGVFYERVRFLVEHDLALYAVHLPLDLHPEVGNNIGIARHLRLTDIQPFCAYRGVKVGCKGILPTPASLDEIVLRLTARQGERVRTLPFGPAQVRTIGIVSGDVPREVTQAIEEGLDLYITGEPAHEIYHRCLEEQIHVIFAGHYHSETFGVQLLADRLARETGVETTYLDIPTGL
jgi:dinuclear metal center YbgI/SA1388 family protein